MALFLRSAINNLTYKILSAAIEVHRRLGPGLLESAYQACMVFELSDRGLLFEAEMPLPLTYKTVRLDCSYKIDVFVEQLVVVELKSVTAMAPIFEAQLLTYLKLTDAPIGLLINFNVPSLRMGVKRMLNKDHQLVDRLSQ